MTDLGGSIVIFLKAFDPSRQDKPCILSVIQYGWEDEDLCFRHTWPDNMVCTGLRSIALTTDTTDNFRKTSSSRLTMHRRKPDYLRWTNFMEVKTVFSESCSQTCKINDFQNLAHFCPAHGQVILIFFCFLLIRQSLVIRLGHLADVCYHPRGGWSHVYYTYIYVVSSMSDHNLCSYHICVFGTTCYDFVHFLTFSHVCPYRWVVESCFTLAFFQTNSFKKRLLNSRIGCPSFSLVIQPWLWMPKHLMREMFPVSLFWVGELRSDSSCTIPFYVLGFFKGCQVSK